MTTDAHAATELFEKQNQIIRSRVLRLRKIKNIIYMLACLIAAGLFGYAFSQQPVLNNDEMANRIAPLLMGGTLVTTLLFLCYMVLHIPAIRAIYDAGKELFPRLNALLPEHERQPFKWHIYFSNDGGKSAGMIIGSIAVRIISLFLLVLAYQTTWVRMLHAAGRELQNEHFAFMGFIDFALFSILVLCIVVVLAARISRLARK